MRTSSGPPTIIVTCCLLALAAFAAFGFNGYGANDHGFTLAYSWRIVGGQVPYLDFLYRRPPGSIYLHTIWLALPDGWAFVASRAAMYAELGLAAALPTAAALRAGLLRFDARLLLLTVAFLACSIHNFPAMPWSTVDGVFFSSIGFAFLIVSSGREASRPRALWYRAGASLSIALAVLCKQPFAFVALAFALLSLAELLWAGGRSRTAWFAASALPGAGVALVSVGLLASCGALSPLVDQILLPGSDQALLQSGWQEYTSGFALGGLCVGIAWSALLQMARHRPSLASWLGPVEALLLGCALIAAPDYFELGRGLLCGLAGLTLARTVMLALGRPLDAQDDLEAWRLIVALGVIAIAWSSSLSWGYRMPTLGLGAMAVALPQLPRYPAEAGRRPWALGLASAGVVAALAVGVMVRANLLTPRYDRARELQTEALHEIFPRFGRLYSNARMAAQLTELRAHIERYALEPNRDFAVVDEFPLAHYLVDRQNAARLDWYFRYEMRGATSALADELIAQRPVAILQKRVNASPTRFGGARWVPCELRIFAPQWRPIARRLFEAGRLVEAGEHFCVIDLAQPPDAGVGAAAG